MDEKQGKASTRAKNKYRDKTYDRMELVLPKGKKEELKAFLQPTGESVNSFVNHAIDEAMEKTALEQKEGETD